MTAARDWVAGARPRTLPAAIVPVAVGSGVAAGYGDFIAWRAGLALVVALALQIGVNYANDYSDGIRGTDEQRVGPVRLVGSGLATPRQVLSAALASFFVAGLAGLVLAAVVSWWLLLLGAAAIARGLVLHRRQPAVRIPGARRGLRLRVLRRSGRCIGTAYVQMERLTWLALGRRGPGRPARLRVARDQQPAGHPDRRGQPASARSRSCSATSAPGSCTRCAWPRRSRSRSAIGADRAAGADHARGRAARGRAGQAGAAAPRRAAG